MKKITVQIAIEVLDGDVRMPFQGYDFGNGLAICKDVQRYSPDSGELIPGWTWQVCHVRSGWTLLGDLRTRKLAVAIAQLFVGFLPSWNIAVEEAYEILYSTERQSERILLQGAIRDLIAQDAR